MSTPYLDISFRHGRPFAAYLHCSAPRSVAASRELGHGLVLDVAEDGTVIGLEVTDPQHTTATMVSAVLAPLGVGVSTADLAPLAA